MKWLATTKFHSWYAFDMSPEFLMVIRAVLKKGLLLLQLGREFKIITSLALRMALSSHDAGNCFVIKINGY
jgi:hypothetical protein